MHRDSWILDQESKKPLTPSQIENAKTWYDYEYWFNNVYRYERLGNETNLEERIQNIVGNPALGFDQLVDQAKELSAGSASERSEQKRLKGKPTWLYRDLSKDYPYRDYLVDMIDEDPDWAGRSEKEKEAEVTDLLARFYEQKIAEFLAFDDDILTALRGSPVYQNFATGKYEKYNIINGIPDAASIVQKFVSQSINSNLESGLPRIQKFIDSVDGDEVEGLKRYIRTIIRPALANEVQTQSRRLKLNLKEVSEGSLSPMAMELAEDRDADPAGVEREFEEASSQFQELAGAPSIQDAMRNGYSGPMKVIVDTVYPMLTAEQQMLYEHVYGPSSPRDYWKEGGQRGRKRDVAEFSTLNLNGSSVVDDWNNKMREIGNPPITKETFSNKVTMLDSDFVGIAKKAWDADTNGIQTTAPLLGQLVENLRKQEAEEAAASSKTKKSPGGGKSQLTPAQQAALQRAQSLKNNPNP
jgi:hypothetical protein